MEIKESRKVVEDLIQRSRIAQDCLSNYSQMQVDKLAAAIVYKLSRKDVAMYVAKLAYEETKMGNVESKYAKLTGKIPGCFYDVKDQKTVDIIDYNPETGITEIAKPIGI